MTSSSDGEWAILAASDRLWKYVVATLAVALSLAAGTATRLSCAQAVAVAEQRPATAPAGALRVAAYQWHDVDTAVDVVVRLPWGVLLDEPRGIRDDGFDGWELGARRGTTVTDAERERGRRALDELRVLSVNRSLWVVPGGPGGRGKRDAFGRLLGRLYLERAGEWIEVRAWALANGHVRTDPGTP